MKPAQPKPWENDAAYFDGSGFAEITFTDEATRMQRFEQEVRLLSHNGILLLLHNEVNALFSQSFFFFISNHLIYHANISCIF